MELKHNWQNCEALAEIVVRKLTHEQMEKILISVYKEDFQKNRLMFEDYASNHNFYGLE